MWWSRHRSTSAVQSICIRAPHRASQGARGGDAGGEGAIRGKGRGAGGGEFPLPLLHNLHVNFMVF